MKKLFTLVALIPGTFLFSQTCNLLNHSCTNTTNLFTSGVTANAGATYACVTGNYVLYSSSSGNPYIATDDLLVDQGNSATLHFKAKKSSTYTGTAEVWAHVGGYCNFNVYTTPFNNNGWVQIGSFNPTTTCATYGPFTVPSDIIGGNMISYCIVLKNASSTNWVSIDDICVSQVTGTTVPTTYNETFGTSSTGWYPQSGYVSVPYHTYKNASDAYVLLSTGQGGGSDKAAYFYTGFDFCSTVSGTGITTREINTSGYTNGEIRISFKSRYPCSGTLSYTFDEDYTSYSPEVYIMEGPDDGTNTWVQLPVNYYFSDYTWRVASYDISAYKNSNIRIKIERGGFCGTAMEAVDNIKILDRNCAISLLSCGTITGETNPLPSTQYNYSVPAVTGATYYKWFVRSAGNLYEAAPYIVSGQGTQNVTIDFGSLPAAGLRVLCIPYDADPSVVADACYAEIGYLGVTLNTTTPLTLDNSVVTDVTCFGEASGSIALTVSGGTAPYTYAWSPNVSTNDIATNLTAGTYQIVITDQNGEEITETVTVNQPTELLIDGLTDAVMCEGETYTTAATVSGGTGAYTYTWTGNNISNVNALNPDFTPGSTSTYDLEVTDANGCQANGQFELTVNDAPDVSLTSDLVMGCAPLTVNFSNLSIPSGTSCLFTFGDGNTEASCSSASNTYLNPGVYDVTLEVTGTNGCVGSAFLNNYIAVYGNPVVDLGGPYELCNGETQVLDAGAGILVYDWNTSETSQTISVTASGTYSVTVTNMNGCETTDDAVVTFNTPVVELGGPVILCAGETQVLDAGSGFTSYDWSTSETSQTISVSTSDTYSVTVTDADGCEATDAITVTVNAPLTIDLGGPYEFCNGSSQLLDAGAGFVSYDWNTSETSQTISVTASGVYDVTVTDADGCEATDNTTITVNTPVVELNGPYEFCEGQSQVLDAGAGFSSYAWSTSETSQTISVTTSGVYTVTVTDADGCEATDMVTIDAIAYPSVNLGEKIMSCGEPVVLDAGAGYDEYLWSTTETTQTITVTSSGNYWVQVSEGPCQRSDTVIVDIVDCVGISELDDTPVKVYPNPVNTVLYVEHIPENALLFIYDASGKLILEKTAAGTTATIPVESLARGMYTLVITAEDKILRSSFVKE